MGGARAVDLPARSFDLAHPGVAPPLHRNSKMHEKKIFVWCDMYIVSKELNAPLIQATHVRKKHNILHSAI